MLKVTAIIPNDWQSFTIWDTLKNHHKICSIVFVCVFMQETRIRVEKDHQRTGCKLNLINPGHGDSVSHVFITETPDILQEWLDALWQHIYDQGQFN